MAVRYVATRLAIEGEQECKRIIADMNREYKTLQSELKLVESEFRGQANSMEALAAKGEALNKLYDKQSEKVEELKRALENAKNAQGDHSAAVEDYKAKIATAEKELEKLKDSTGDTSEEQAKLTAEIKGYKQGLEEAEAKQAAAGRGVQDWQRKLNNAEKDVNDLSYEIKENNRYLDEAKASADGCATSIDRFGKETKEAKDGAKGFGQETEAAVSAVAAVLMAAGVQKTFSEIKEAIWSAIEASNEFESAITGVFKTVEATSAQRREITEGITELSLRIPATTSELADLGQIAGQLGIQTDNILAFVEVVANMGVATDMTAQAAAETMAQLANIMQTPQSEFEKMGSAVVDLGNKFATNEPKILEMGLRIAGAGKTAGMTEAEVLGLATALSSLGIEAQAGGSSISRVISNMQQVTEMGTQNIAVLNKTGMSLRELELFADADSSAFKAMAQSMGYTSTELKKMVTGQRQLEDFANVAGMTANEFSRAFKEDAAGALSSFILGLAKLDDEGQSAVVTLNELGLNELRVRDALLRTTNASELFTSAIETSSNAWEENIALQTEANTRYATTESQMELFKNSVNALKVSIGDQFNPVLKTALDIGQDMVGALTDFVQRNPWVISAVTALATALGILAGGVVALTAAIKLAELAQKAWNTATASHPIGLIVTAITAAIAAIAVFGITLKDSTSSVDELTVAATAAKEGIENLNKTVSDTETSTAAAADLANQYIDRLVALEKQGLNTVDAQKEYQGIVELLNTLIPDLNVVIDEQTGLIEGGTLALRNNTEAWRENALQQAYMEKTAELQKALVDVEWELAENQIKLNAATAEGNRISAESEKVYAQIADALGITVKELDELKKENEANMAVTLSLNDETKGLYDTYNELARQAVKNTDEQRVLQEAIKQGEETVVSFEVELGKASDTMERLSAATTGAADASDAQTGAYEGQVAALATLDESLTALQRNYSNLETQYAEAYEKVAETVGKSLGLFNEVTTKSEMKIKDFIGALDSQLKFMDDYADNMKKAVERGVDEGLVKQLSDGSEDSAKILQAIVNGSDKEIQELNKKLAQVEEGKNDFTSVMADMQTNYSENMDGIAERTEKLIVELNKQEEAFKAGADTAEGYADGLESEFSRIKTLANNIASAVSSAMSNAAKLSDVKVDGSHMAGLPRVPYDGYIAELHEGERVLTASEARAYVEKAMPTSFMEPWAGGGTKTSRAEPVAQSKIEQNLYISSPTPLTPSQIARESKNALKRLVK